jgi:alpha-beta hydrolase superfamily lysophospholipase
LPQLADQTCQIYWTETGETAQARCREVLQMQLQLNPLQLHSFLQTQIGQTLLAQLSQLIDWPTDARSQSRLHQTLMDMVAHTDRFSVLSLLYHLSTHLKLKTERFLATAKQVELLLDTTDQILEHLQVLSDEAAHSTADLSDVASDVASVMRLAPALRSQETEADHAPVGLQDDPRLPGPAGIERTTLNLRRQTVSPSGQKQLRKFRVLLYTPTPWHTNKTPVVVISHGLAAGPDDLAQYAEHLASHGYVVAVPQHPGSDTEQVRGMLAGEAEEVFQIQEFIDRPLDISHVLNELERRNQSQYQGRLELTAVGVMGQSFGGYTALALAGATIDFDKLEEACRPILETPNLSMLLQCRALELPRHTQSLKDERVRAILPLDPVGSHLFGPRGIAQIQVPVLMVTGSEDKTAPIALEPLQLFPWLTTPHRYLAVIKGKSHIHDVSKLLSALKLKLTQETPVFRLNPPIIDSYLKALSLAFFETWLSDRLASCLSAGYVHSISRAPHDLYFIAGDAGTALEPSLLQLQHQLSELGAITIQHGEGLFNAAEGFSLYYQSWLPTQPIQAVVVIVHGLGGHSGLFSNVVKALVPQGYGVYSFDLRGHGRSPGQRGHINRWAEYSADLDHFLAMVKEEWSVPCFLMGHSLGGVIALDYAMHQPEALAGIIVSAVPLSNGVSMLRLVLGRLLSRLWPRFSLTTGLQHVPPSRDPAVVIAYNHDPLRHCQGTARLATEFLETVKGVQTHADQLRLPLLMLHGQADTVALPDHSRTFFESLTLPDKTWKLYAGGYHELHDDINHEQVLADLTHWLNQHLLTSSTKQTNP